MKCYPTADIIERIRVKTVGLSKDAASKKLSDHGWEMRIAKEDGVKFPRASAAEFKLNQISVKVWKGKVVKLWHR